MKKIKTICLLALLTLLILPFQQKAFAKQGEIVPSASSKAGIILRKEKNKKPPEPSGSQSGNGSVTKPPAKTNGKNNYPQTGEDRKTSFMFTLSGALLIAATLFFIWKKKAKSENK